MWLTLRAAGKFLATSLELAVIVNKIFNDSTNGWNKLMDVILGWASKWKLVTPCRSFSRVLDPVQDHRYKVMKMSEIKWTTSRIQTRFSDSMPRRQTIRLPSTHFPTTVSRLAARNSRMLSNYGSIATSGSKEASPRQFYLKETLCFSTILST